MYEASSGNHENIAVRTRREGGSVILEDHELKSTALD
jgi:hypothetical protein